MLHRLRLAWYLPLYAIAHWSSCGEAIIRDALRARGANPDLCAATSDCKRLSLEGLATPQVRSVVYHRLYQAAGWERVASKLLSRFLPGLRDFELNCEDIGAGLVIGHGYASVLWARRIGRDCMIHQHVTLGVNADEYPIIGDRVWISPGAAVLGGVTIGDDAVIGAGSVVLRDVAPGSVVAGIPARVISNRGAARPGAPLSPDDEAMSSAISRPPAQSLSRSSADG